MRGYDWCRHCDLEFWETQESPFCGKVCEDNYEPSEPDLMGPTNREIHERDSREPK